MSAFDATALTSDPDGLAFLKDVLGTGAESAAINRSFPLEAWTPKPGESLSLSGLQGLAAGPRCGCFADAAA